MNKKYFDWCYGVVRSFMQHHWTIWENASPYELPYDVREVIETGFMDEFIEMANEHGTVDKYWEGWHITYKCRAHLKPHMKDDIPF